MPIPSSRQHWAPEDYGLVMTGSLGFYRFIQTDALGTMVTTVFGARVVP